MKVFIENLKIFMDCNTIENVMESTNDGFFKHDIYIYFFADSAVGVLFVERAISKRYSTCGKSYFLRLR